MDETILTQEQGENDIQNDIIPPEDDTEFLENDAEIRKKEGSAGDSVSMQTALCMIIAVGFIVLNIFKPDIAEALFIKLREISGNTENVIPNPIDIISAYISS